MPKLCHYTQEDDNENNTYKTVNPNLEYKIQGKTYYFSIETQNPTQDNSVFDNAQDFVHAMLNSTAPTMLMYGGSYSKGHEINVKDAFPIQFPFGTGGPNCEEKEKLMYPTKLA